MLVWSRVGVDLLLESCLKLDLCLGPPHSCKMPFKKHILETAMPGSQICGFRRIFLTL